MLASNSSLLIPDLVKDQLYSVRVRGRTADNQLGPFSVAAYATAENNGKEH